MSARLRLTEVSELFSEQGGGVRTYVLEKLARASKAGVALTVIVPGDDDATEARGSGVMIRVKSPRLPLDPRYHLFASASRLQQAIAKTAPQMIEVSSALAAGSFVADFPGTAPRALVLHQDASLAIGHALLDRLVSPERVDALARAYFHRLAATAARYDASVVSGEWLAERLRAFGVPRVHAIGFGIARGRFDPAHADPRLKAELLARAGVSREGRLLLAVSRHHPEKRLFTLMEAFARARARSREPLGLVIFGDGPLAPLVRRRAARLSGVYVAGFTEDRTLVARAMASADLFVHGSGAETYGIVLAEAIASGLPFVAPSMGGARDLARPGYAALYTAGDAEGAARAILEMLGRDRRDLSSALSSARDEVVRDVGEHFEALFEFYRGLVRAPMASRGASG